VYGADGGGAPSGCSFSCGMELLLRWNSRSLASVEGHTLPP
jgi:hypothetical protein